METFEKVTQIISQQLGISSDFDFTANTTWEELNADSLDLVEIVMALEDEYDIEISDDEIGKMENMGDLVGFIDRLK